MDNLCYQQCIKLPEAITNTTTAGETVATKETTITETFNALVMQTKMGINVVDIQQQQQQQPQQQQQQHRTTLLQTLNNMNVDTELQSQQQKLQTFATNSNSSQTITSAGKQKNIAIITPNNSHNNSGSNRIVGDANSNKSPKVLRKRQQQQHRHIDISKFNRSNRKSKNCAIFYFKHLDTDNETNYGLSSSASHTSDLLKSADASSDDDEGWLYTTAPPAVTATQATIAAATVTDNDLDCLDSTSANSTLNSSIVADGIQSSTVSSSTGETISTNVTAAAGTSAIAIISDDSDKENKEALAAIAAHNRIVVTSSSASLLNSAQFSNTDFQLTTTSASSSAAYIANNSIINSNCNNSNNNKNNNSNSNNNSSGSSSCNSSKISRSDCGSSCSSNDLLTETTTTATTTTQIPEMHCQHLNRNEMQLQINNGHNGSNNNNVEKSNHIIVAGNNNSNHVSYNKYCNKNNNQQCLDVKNLHQQHLSATEDNNGNTQNDKLCFYTRADICNITVKPSDTMYIQQQQLLSPGKRLPPRSPAKSHKSKSGNNATMSTTKGKVSHESIKQLVLEAEHLVRDEALKTPTKQKHSAALKISTTVKKREVIMPGPIKQRVQEWLEHQPTTPSQMHNKTHDTLNGSNNLKGANNRTDDCEASGEASETDSIPQQVSDSSEGFTDSIATCMQTSTNSYGNSTEHMGGSAEPIMITNSNAVVHGCGSSNQSLNIVKTVNRRQNNTRRKSERPWSVSCLSQLTTATQVAKNVNNTNDLATHSISESALDSLSPRRPRVASTSAAHNRSAVKTYDSKGSLKRRKTRKKKLSNSTTTTAAAAAAYSIGKKTDSGSEETTEIPKLTHTLLMKSCESMSAQQIQEITAALLNLQKSTASTSTELIANVNATATASKQQQQQQQQQLQQQQQQQQQQNESEEEAQLMKPNFRVGSYTTAYMRSEARLGSLAALATYMNDEEQQGEYTTGTEDHHSSFSETAWDNYQEKYNSENYSEGFDSDAARRLLEFGDDYRNFIDSQSDCCSSLSAANNLDSLSPPRMDSLQQNEAKIITQDTIVSSVDHARRRRALELEYERRRKTLEVRRKSCQDSSDNQPRSPTISLSSSANALTPKNGEKFNYQQQRTDSINRKLDFGMSHSAQSLRRTSESDTSTRRRKVDERRRSSRNLEKSIKLIPATTSSSCDDSDDEKEMRNLLEQSRNRLEDTRALKIRCHLLRPEDYGIRNLEISTNMFSEYCSNH
ncbi:putative uncharacterized protein DDB_G0277255 [Teleopsis dalmanni]|uniref:putative uncharacterized protein DDB_G0277255 n=1 Tax=Teleopsis dalmanni TaxID=139649 RepID=UPI0018CEE1AE|nr:putative uncharacterized protein DDB_G0277255 [Teleopsis dalmanni]